MDILTKAVIIAVYVIGNEQHYHYSSINRESHILLPLYELRI